MAMNRFALLVGLLVSATAYARPKSIFKCFEGGLDLSRHDEVAIREIMRPRSRFPVVDIRIPSPKEQSPEGAIEARTLTHGDCCDGGGDRFWVRKSKGKWKVVKKAGFWGVGTSVGGCRTSR